MHEILRHLPEGVRVLDLGSRSGSFDASEYPIRVVRLDLEVPEQNRPLDFVKADASNLPFRAGSFDAVVANHSLEHIERPAQALEEIGRVVKPTGAIYIAVPDASTFSDRLYRWLGRGGGHVNAFRSRRDLIREVERCTGMRFTAGRALLSSLSMLNRKNLGGCVQRKLMLLGGGREGLLVFWSALARMCDRTLGTRLSLYGWALYFGAVGEEVDRRAWSNVCVRCGSGASSDWLESSGRVKTKQLIPSYLCEKCGAWNVFTRDAGFERLASD